MKKFINLFKTAIFFTITFTVVSVIDLIAMVVMCITKGVRIAAMRIWSFIERDDEMGVSDMYEVLKCWVNATCNSTYKYYIDELYPVDEEEDDEDEDL